jgi:DNA modification methylase
VIPSVTILQGDWVERLRELPDETVQCCVTSPPYYGLRNYGVEGQLGLELTPDEYVQKLVAGFREVRRVLKDDGTLWLNLGDSYAAHRGGTSMPAETLARGISGQGDTAAKRGRESATCAHRNAASFGLKHKDLIGIPWRVAFALQADGWWLRSDIIWAKPNPMPESVTDRPTKSHEYLFLLTKASSYYYDAEAIKEGVTGNAHAQGNGIGRKFDEPGSGNRANWDAKIAMHNATWADLPTSRNKRSVWTVPTNPYSEAHFATFPPDLIKPCILAGSKPGETILDPFGGSGTTGMVALELGRNAVLVELNPEYVRLIDRRCAITPGFLFTEGKE